MRFARSSLQLALGALAAAALFGHSRKAAAQAGPALGSHQLNLRAELGLRTQFVADEALDPFADDDALSQLSAGASYAFFASERLSLAGSFLYDFGGRSSKARNLPSSLSLHRFALGPEARYHVLDVLAVTLRVAPTLLRTHAELELAPDALAATAWKLGADATAGVAIELYGYASGASRKPRLWLIAEGGYGWSAATELELEPEDPGPSTPSRLDPVNLGELAVSGPLFRISAAVSF